MSVTPDATAGERGREIVIGVGAMAVSGDPRDTLITYSLGSCLGITLYDPVSRVAGLLHAMLPDSALNAEKASANPGMFLDTGMVSLFRAAYRLGLNRARTRVCVAGAAQLAPDQGLFNIGARNLERFKDLMHRNRLSVAAADVGGATSRTLSIEVSTGRVFLKTSGKPKSLLLWEG